MSQPLFRAEVIEARRQRWLGPVVLDTPPLLRVLLALLLAALALALGFAATADYSRRTRVAGVLVPDRGLVTLLAPAAGVVDGVEAEEGEPVAAGVVLVRLASPAASDLARDGLAAAESAFAERRSAVLEGLAAQRGLLGLRRGSLQAQRLQFDEERGRMAAEHAARVEQRALSAQALARLQVLLERRFVSDSQVAQQAAELRALEAGLRALERQQATLARQALELGQQLGEIPGELARLEAQARRELAALAQERRELHARHAARVLAPVAGTVAHRFVEPGANVRAGDPLLALVPAGSRLQAHLQVPGSAIGRLAVGDEVRLRLAAYPYQAFGHHPGQVLRIGRSAVQRDGAGEPEYRVVVALARQAVEAGGESRPLSPGLVVEAEVLGERRSLAAWLLAPLRALRARTTREDA